MREQVVFKTEDGQSLTVTRRRQAIAIVAGAAGFSLDLENASELAHVLEMMVVDACIERNESGKRPRRPSGKQTTEA